MSEASGSAAAAEAAASKTAESPSESASATAAEAAGEASDEDAASGTAMVVAVVVELFGVFLDVAAEQDEGYGDEREEGAEADERGTAPVAAVLCVAVFARHHGLDDVEGLDDGLVVVAVAELRYHLVVDDAFAEEVGQRAFDPVACGDGHGAPVLVLCLAFDEDDDTVVEVLLAHAPSLADALRHGVLVVASEGGGDDDEYLVGGGVVEGYQPLLQGVALLVGQDARVVVHQPVGLLRQPPRLRLKGIEN